MAQGGLAGRPDPGDARVDLIFFYGATLHASPFPSSSPDRLALLIDGVNFHGTLRTLNAEVDYRKLRGYFSDKGILVNARYYTVCRSDGYTPIRPLLDWLSYNGFTVIAKPQRGPADRENDVSRGGVAIDLTCDALNMVPHVDKIVLCSGDGRYHALARFVQKRGVQFLAVSTRQCNPSMIADELRRQIDDFIDLADILPLVSLVRG